jgi:surface protein
MRNMFSRAVSFNGDISGWDVTNVTDMSYMFNGYKEGQEAVSVSMEILASGMSAKLRA